MHVSPNKPTNRPTLNAVNLFLDDDKEFVSKRLLFLAALSIHPSVHPSIRLSFVRVMSDYLHIEFQDAPLSPLTLKLFDVQGKILLERKLDKVYKNQPIHLNLNKLPTGNHILKIQNAEQKLIINKVISIQ